MYYASQPSQALRFGDIVCGFVCATPDIDRPRLESVGDTLGPSFSVLVSHARFSVILSPCCSIGDKIISLAPLTQILPGLLRNPYFSEDLTRINRPMEPQQAVAPEIWDKLKDTEKQKRLANGVAYALVDNFIFPPHDLLPKYVLQRKEGNIEVNSYMVDFRQIFRVTCTKIVTAANSPLDAKYLELSVPARKELREKIGAYFGRTPQEDLQVIATA